MTQVDLSSFSTNNFDKGAGALKRSLWYFVNAVFVRTSLNPFMGTKVFWLRLFGARIGEGICIKNEVKVKFPWKLTIGDNCWIGEDVWIDNLDYVTIGNNVCISQGAMLLTGNHDYTIYNMPYRNAPITIEDGAWIGAKSIVCPGVTVHCNAILTAGSVATKDLEEDKTHQGNPAACVRVRIVKGGGKLTLTLLFVRYCKDIRRAYAA